MNVSTLLRRKERKGCKDLGEGNISLGVRKAVEAGLAALAADAAPLALSQTIDRLEAQVAELRKIQSAGQEGGETLTTSIPSWNQ